MNSVTSFDVFDTLLTRSVAVPRDLHVAVGTALQKLGLTKIDPTEMSPGERTAHLEELPSAPVTEVLNLLSPDELRVARTRLNYPQFALKRIRSEQSAGQADRSGQPTLDAIYTVLGAQLNWTEADISKARQVELDFEAQTLTPVPGALEVVNQARAEGRRIIFISDTYLPSDFIRAQLERHGFFQANDRLFASGEEKASKAAGELFEVARAKLGNPTDWLHIGDDPHADDTMPTKRGLKTLPRSQARLTRYEAILRGGLDPLVAPLWQSRVAAACRLARLEANPIHPRTDAIARVSTDIAAPLLISFVIWILQQAERNGLKRLYFLARDGQILLKIAQAIQQHHHSSIDCRYLAASRQAWHPAAIIDFDKDDLERIQVAGGNISFRNVLKLTALEAEQCSERLQKFGFKPAEFDMPTSAARRREWESILAAGHFNDVIRAGAAEKRGLLLDYLRQEKFFDLPACGIVDIGWFGRLQASLDKILSQVAASERPHVTGFYFGIKPHSGVPEHLVRHGFWNECMPNREVTPLEMALLERFTAADHGSVVGFRRGAEKKVEPEFSEPRNTRALDWGLALMQKSIEGVGAKVGALEEFREIGPASLLKVAIEALDELIARPSSDEALAWGGFPMSSQQFESTYEVLAPDWTWAKVIAAIRDRNSRPTVWWKEAAKQRRTILPIWLYLRGLDRPIQGARRAYWKIRG